MTGLEATGHGSILGGRYRLQDRVRVTPDGAAWRAVDEILERPVAVRLLRPGHPHAAEAADAARRVVLIEDVRLTRVLDVGQQASAVYVVSEHHEGSSLARLVRQSPLPADDVRRLVGEAAQALDRAAQRGLHHLLLGPQDLLVRPDGTVKIIGLAVEAAAAGMDAMPAAERAHTDAVALAALTYAGLTGRWPLEREVELEPAPRQGGVPVGVDTLASGLPDDLVALCNSTFGSAGGGPLSAGEVAAWLAPWSAARPLTQSGPPSASPTSSPPAAAELFAPVPQPGSGSSEPSSARTLLPTDPTRPMAAVPADLASPPSPAPPTPMPPPRSVEPRHPAPSAPPVPTTAAASPQPGRTGQPAPWSPQGAPSPGPPPHGGGGRGPESDLPWPSSWPGTRDPVEEPSLGIFPLAPVPEPPSESQSRKLLLVVAGVLLLLLAVSVYSLRGIKPDTTVITDGGPAFTPSARPTTPATPKVTGGSSQPADPATESPAVTPSPTVVAAGPELVEVLTLDPKGDQEEHPELVRRAFDGDPQTFWRTDGYKSAEFGGIKDGVGLLLDLGRPTPINKVSVQVAGQGGVLQLRGTNDPTSAGGTLLATSPVQSSEVVLTPPAGTVVPRYLVVWCTELPQREAGKYRLDVAEISVK